MKAPLIPHGTRLIQGAAGVAASSLFAWMVVSKEDEEANHTATSIPESETRSLDGSSMFKIYRRNGISCLSGILDSRKASSEATVSSKQQHPMASKRTNPIVEYDFVVLGHGNAGRSAVETLKQQCPGATIALVDPLRPILSSNNAPKLKYYAQPALAFHPPTRTVELIDFQLKYKHAILVATGSRGAPPPMALLDPQCLNRVLELRPTAVVGNTKRPALQPETVRQILLMAASQGARVCVLGSGWEAIDLAVAAAKTSNAQPPLLAFGSAGPLCHILPRYLSTAVTKRLRNHRVDIQERSLVRYVAHHEASGSHRMEVHTAKSFDLLDTQRTLVDLLVVAPFVDGPRGTAVLPSVHPPHDVEEHSFGRTWYQSWSQLSSPPSEPSTVVCYADDGRVSVNAELSAANKVYAAGSVAKYPNSTTGHAHAAGEGSVDGALAGRLAALHMSRDYQERNRSLLPTARGDMIEPATFASQSFPIFRSDISPYNPENMNQSSLSEVGINALVVGHCDSDKMSTHGFWWTNQADKRHHTADKRYHDGDQRPRRRSKRNSESSPVYGSGIVFYLDGTGTIRGIMNWGLPIAKKGSTDVNSDLVDRMISIINTNGGIAKDKSKNDPLLTENHLETESRKLAQIAYLGRRRINRRLTDKAQSMTKPLHRYTAAKPPSVTSIGLLKRKDQSVFSELLGENIYIKDNDYYMEEGELRPPNLLYIYPIQNPGWRSSEEQESWKNPYLLSRDDRMDEAWRENERRARPPKEEPLWLRRGYASRGVNNEEAMRDAMLANMRSGRFADGSEPF